MPLTYHREMHTKAGASRVSGLAAGSEPRVSMYQLLHPEQYPKEKRREKPPSIESRHEMITAYLRANGPATAPAMEAAFNLRRDCIGGLLRRGIPGIVVIRQEKSEHTRRMCAVWALQDVHTDGDDE